MMTPLRFEQLYESEWLELEVFLDTVGQVKGGPATLRQGVAGLSSAQAAALYRRACEHLALARARAYPAYIVARLERLTARAHQHIYYRREFGLARLHRLAAADFPRAVRDHRWYITAAAAAFVLPTVVLGLLVYKSPELILSIVSPETAASYQNMYSPDAESLGRSREASTDWLMFGYYIRNNIGVAFQCFAGGLFVGLGTLFFLAYNGAVGGAVAGYLTERGLSSTFYSFVATHSAFELTAIVIAGAAGLRLGHSLLAPGRLTRQASLVVASRDAVVLLYGVIALLLLAAAVEAFWSSSQWVSATTKYWVAACCWAAVLAYLTVQGRRAS